MSFKAAMDAKVKAAVSAIKGPKHGVDDIMKVTPRGKRDDVLKGLRMSKKAFSEGFAKAACGDMIAERMKRMARRRGEKA
jgi:hypothetical protein